MAKPNSGSLCNPSEYYAPSVTKAEQVSFLSTEGGRFRDFLAGLNPGDLDGTEFIPGKVNRGHIPKASGVYFVFLRGELLYIGQTCSLARRIRGNHGFLTPLKKSGEPFTVKWLLLPREKRLKAETFLTRKFLLGKGNAKKVD